MTTARPTRFLLPLALTAVALLGGSSLVASAQPAPEVTITDEAFCDDGEPFVVITVVNDGDVAIGVDVLLDDEPLLVGETIAPGEQADVEAPHPGVDAVIDVVTSTDSLLIDSAVVETAIPDCETLTGVALEPACDGTEPILNIALTNLGDVDQGVNVYLDDEPIATELTIPTDAVPVITVPYPGVGAYVEVVSSTDELFFGDAELTAEEPDCTSTTTTVPVDTDTDPDTVTPPAARPIAGNASYTG